MHKEEGVEDQVMEDLDMEDPEDLAICTITHILTHIPTHTCTTEDGDHMCFFTQDLCGTQLGSS